MEEDTKVDLLIEHLEKLGKGGRLDLLLQILEGDEALVFENEEYALELQADGRVALKSRDDEAVTQALLRLYPIWNGAEEVGKIVVADAEYEDMTEAQIVMNLQLYQDDILFGSDQKSLAIEALLSFTLELVEKAINTSATVPEGLLANVLGVVGVYYSELKEIPDEEVLA